MSHLSFLKLWPLLLIVLLVATGCRSSRSLRGERFVLVVDAGHGGNDQGPPGDARSKKEVNLKSSPTRLQTDSQTMSRRGSPTNPPRRRVHQSQRPGRHGQLLPGGFVYLHPFNSARGMGRRDGNVHSSFGTRKP